MFNLANCNLQRGFSPGRYLKWPGAKARLARSRAPGNFCFSWRSRHARGAHCSLQATTACTELEVSA